MIQFPSQFGRPVAARSRQGLLLGMALFLGLSGCQSMFLATGRPQFELLPEKQEIELGAKAYQEVLQTEPKSQNAHLTQMLDRVGKRIAAVAERPDFQWEFTLLSGPKQDAFCLPGGKVAVYEGILPVCAHEAGLAVLLSHEIAHVLSNHGNERMSSQIHAADGDSAFPRIRIGRESKRVEMLKNVYGLGALESTRLPFSRTQEEEADSIGLLLMARAGYDPEEAVRFWNRFRQRPHTKAPELLALHPHDDSRAARLNEIVPRALSVYQSATQRHGLGEQIPMQALAKVSPTLPTTHPATTVASAPAAAVSTPAPVAAPSSSLAAVSIAPAPIVQTAPGATSTSAALTNDTPVTFPNLGAPTVEGTLKPPTATPIVTASFEVMAPAGSAVPVSTPVSTPVQDTTAKEPLAPASSVIESPAAEPLPPASEVSDGWKPHQ